MSAELNERDREIVHGKNFAHLSTLRRDGAPISTVLWVDEDQGTLVMNTAMDRVKVVNINHDPRVAVSIHRQENPQQSLALVGTASLETDHAEEVIDHLTQKYMGVAKFPSEWRGPEEVRVTIRVRPESIHRYGY